jgi:hypothetical protein
LIGRLFDGWFRLFIRRNGLGLFGGRAWAYRHIHIRVVDTRVSPAVRTGVFDVRIISAHRIPGIACDDARSFPI